LPKKSARAGNDTLNSAMPKYSDMQLDQVFQALMRFGNARGDMRSDERARNEHGALMRAIGRRRAAQPVARVHVSLSGVAVFCIL
jgi:hypothetical protein